MHRGMNPDGGPLAETYLAHLRGTHILFVPNFVDRSFPWDPSQVL